jgi:hypothetical protein
VVTAGGWAAQSHVVVRPRPGGHREHPPPGRGARTHDEWGCPGARGSHSYAGHVSPGVRWDEAGRWTDSEDRARQVGDHRRQQEANQQLGQLALCLFGAR